MSIRAVAAGLTLAALFAFPAAAVEPLAAPDLPIHDGVGGEFSARSSLGRVVDSKEFDGKVRLLFFGYTSCQDICPATLSHLTGLTRRLGPAADDVQVILVTVDPENDTEEHLKEYLARFDERFIGLTGTQEEIDQIASMYLVKHDKSHGMKVTTAHNRAKAFTDSAYLYSHSQQIYLLDKSGRTRGMLYVGSPLEEMEASVRTLLAEPTSHDADPTEGSMAAPTDSDNRTHDGGNHESMD